jgi:hypothetical protein
VVGRRRREDGISSLTTNHLIFFPSSGGPCLSKVAASDLRVATSPRRHATIHLHSRRANVPSALFAVMLRSGRRASTLVYGSAPKQSNEPLVSLSVSPSLLKNISHSRVSLSRAIITRTRCRRLFHSAPYLASCPLHRHAGSSSPRVASPLLHAMLCPLRVPKCCQHVVPHQKVVPTVDTQPQQKDVAVKVDVANVCFKCFRCLRGMLQLFRIGIATVDWGCCICCQRSRSLFEMFYLFETYVANALIWMLHMFHTYVATICSRCFSDFILMLQ